MGFLWEGIKVGLVLTLMIGPLFFTLVQTGVEEGFRAGAAVGLGIWVSDFLFMLLVYSGMSAVAHALAKSNITQIIGLGGSVLLSSFGLAMLLSVPRNLYLQDPLSTVSIGTRSSSYISLWLKGFLINSVNPFTLFFWLGLMSTVMVRQDFGGRDALAYFSGILGVIVLGDLAKVLLAKKIRRVLKPFHLLWLRRISGAALIIFGVVLLARVLF